MVGESRDCLTAPPLQLRLCVWGQNRKLPPRPQDLAWPRERSVEGSPVSLDLCPCGRQPPQNKLLSVGTQKEYRSRVSSLRQVWFVKPWCSLLSFREDGKQAMKKAGGARGDEVKTLRVESRTSRAAAWIYLYVPPASCMCSHHVTQCMSASMGHWMARWIVPRTHYRAAPPACLVTRAHSGGTRDIVHFPHSAAQVRHCWRDAGS